MSNVAVANRLGMEFGLLSVLDDLGFSIKPSLCDTVRKQVEEVLTASGISYEEETPMGLLSIFLEASSCPDKDKSIAELLGGEEIILSSKESGKLINQIYHMMLAFVEVFMEDECFEMEKETKALTKKTILTMLDYGNIQLSK